MNQNIKVTILAIIFVIVAVLIIPHTPPAHMPPAHTPATMVMIGDYGNGDPTPQEEEECKLDNGEMYVGEGMWFCEEQ
jgi:hypothetical protein